MSDPQHPDASHEGPIKTPKQLIWTVIASFVVPIAIIVLLVNYVASGDTSGAAADDQDFAALSACRSESTDRQHGARRVAVRRHAQHVDD